MEGGGIFIDEDWESHVAACLIKQIIGDMKQKF